MTTIVDVPLKERAYQVIIEDGVLARLGALVREVAPHQRAALVMDEAIASSWGEVAAEALRRGGYDLVTAAVTAREECKIMTHVSALHDAMIAGRLERRAPLIALGGGITGDVAGFAAATFLRGVPLIQVPTTLLAMVDASIGGKTGVNATLPGGDLGKNLIGAFWQPRRVIVDPTTLSTLPPRERRCGMAEGVKHAVIVDAPLFAQCEAEAPLLAEADASVTHAFIARCAAIKAQIVAEDEREEGRRALLNFGHTFAHAIESVASHVLRHGEAVAIGMVAAARCGEAIGRTEAGTAQRIARLLDALGLPAHFPAELDPLPASDELMHAMDFDKKVEAGVLRLVLPVRIGEAIVDASVPRDAIAAAWRSVGAR